MHLAYITGNCCSPLHDSVLLQEKEPRINSAINNNALVRILLKATFDQDERVYGILDVHFKRRTMRRVNPELGKWPYTTSEIRPIHSKVAFHYNQIVTFNR